MPYIDELLNSGNSPQMRLYWFALDADEVLGQAVENIDIGQELRGHAAAALKEYREHGFVQLCNALEAQEIPVDRLEAVGLTERQLDAKMHGYAAARRPLLQGLFRRPWLRAARWMNSIMGSIAAAFPPAHAFQEVKELIENGAKDIEELERG